MPLASDWMHEAEYPFEYSALGIVCKLLLCGGLAAFSLIFGPSSGYSNALNQLAWF